MTAGTSAGTIQDVGVVIVAAGSGSRASGATGELKQFRWVGDKPMLLHAVHAFQRRPDVALVVCVRGSSSATWTGCWSALEGRTGASP
jgi:2-C-methyl-D-erythritol 4-phosphate cytidylyltransferase